MQVLNPVLLLLFLLADANLEIGTFKYTADPAPFVHAGRLYVTTSHDLLGQQGWLMKDYCVLSTVRAVRASARCDYAAAKLAFMCRTTW